MSERPRDLAFISYHHDDRSWLERLEVHLKPLLRQGALSHWSDTQVQPGEVLQAERELALSRAAVLVLLVSADYLASSELEHMLKVARAYRASILWLPVRASGYWTTALSGIVPLLPPERPLALLGDEEAEAALVRICQLIARAVQDASSSGAFPASASLISASRGDAPGSQETRVAPRANGVSGLVQRHRAALLGCVGVTLAILAFAALRHVEKLPAAALPPAPLAVVTPPPELTSDPGGAEVICDRVLIGKTPLQMKLIPATAQELCLRAEDRADQIVELTRGDLGFAPLHVQLTMRPQDDKAPSALPCRILRSASPIQNERPALLEMTAVKSPE